MGILDRVSTIARANVNAMLDQAENPEKMLDQLIRDMASSIDQARNEVARMIADEKELQADANRNQQLAVEWQGKAELAMKSNAEDLAREALHRKLDYDNNAKVYQAQFEAQHQAVEKAKTDFRALQNKYDETVRNREMLIARYHRAHAQEKVSQTISAMSAADPTSELARMETRIRQQEARAEASAELSHDSTDDQFAKLGHDSQVEAELDALRTKLLSGPSS